MTNCDGRTHNVLVGHVVHLLDDSQYRILKITPPSGPVILKKANHSTNRRFLRAPSQLLLASFARDLFQCCGPAVVEAYHQGRPYCFGDIYFADLPEPVNDASV